MSLGRLLESKTAAKQNLVMVLSVYLQARMRPEKLQSQDISVIFQNNEANVNNFKELFESMVNSRV